MTETISELLLRLSEDGSDGVLTGTDAQPLYGSRFDRLLRQGTLREEAPLSHWAVCPDCDCGADWRRLDAEDDQYRARCPLDHTRDVILDVEAIRVFRVDAEALARFLLTATGLSGEIDSAVPGVWDLGTLPSGRRVAVCFERHILDQAHLPALLDPLAAPYLTLLGPAAKASTLIALRAAGIEYVELARVLTIDSTGDLVMTKALIDPAGQARLVLDQKARRVSVDGKVQRVPEQPLTLLTMLVEAVVTGRGGVPNFDIEERLSGRAAKDVARDLRDALSRGRSNKAEIRAWIAADRSNSSYRIALAPEEVELRG